MRSPMLIFKFLLIIVSALLVVAVIGVGIGNRNFNRAFNSKVEQLFKDQQKAERSIITEADIKDLPSPVQRYLRYTGVIGKKRITSVRLKQKGAMRQKPDGDWIPLEAVEYYAVDSPGFVWLGLIRMAPLLTVSAQDMYLNGKGNMNVKLLSTITMVNAKGKEMDEASLMRYFNEMMWFPTAYVGENVNWEPVDANTAKATITDSGISVSAVFSFNEKGEITNFVAERGRDAGGGKLVMTTWSTPITDYKEIAGLKLPVKGEAIWHLDSGEYSYIRLEITDIEYNNPSLYR